MNSIRPATGHTSLDKRAPSPVPVLLCGDPLDCLGQLVVHDSEARDALERHRARAIVIGIHIPDTDHSRKAVKYRLRNAHDTVNTHLRRHPLVRHIIYIVHPDSGQGALIRRLGSCPRPWACTMPKSKCATAEMSASPGS